MLRKLRADFAPQYIAAVFDVAAPTFRDEQAAAMPALASSTARPQRYIDVEYEGYKANRAEMPEDLAQQIPYIRRALEAYRIPILEAAGLRGRRRHRHAGAQGRRRKATRSSSSPATRT